MNPIGYAQEYTSFEVSGVTLDADRMTKEDTIHASVTIRNTGKREGTETLQLYIHDVAASVVRPVKELKGFRKITLKPGEEQKVEFAITEDMLRFLTENQVVESEPGTFEVYVGTDSTVQEKAVFILM